MIYHREGEWHQVARIAGPTHNMLGVVFTTGANQDDPIIEELDVDSQTATSRLFAGEVLREVQEAVREENLRLGTCYSLVRLRLVPTDTPQAGVYGYLARFLVKKAIEAEPLASGSLRAAE